MKSELVRNYDGLDQALYSYLTNGKKGCHEKKKPLNLYYNSIH